MKNMRKVIGLILTATLMSSLLTGCTQSKNASSSSSQANVESKQEKSKEYKPFKVVNALDGNNYEVVFNEAPKRAVSLAGFTTEMMLALGLEDRMAGYAFQDNEILPEFKEAYKKIPKLSDTMPSEEKFLNVQPDFVTGWSSAFSGKSLGMKFFKDNGVNAYIPKSDYPGATMETVYEDFTNLGKIFNVEDKAKEVVDNIKNRINDVSVKVSKVEKPVKVFIYDSGDKAPFTACKGLPTDLIRLAGGKNIFDDGDKAWANVSWEEVVKRNPDYIIVMKYDVSDDDQGKIKFLKNNPALKDISAIKNNKIFVMGLSDVVAGVRNAKAVETMAKNFYPELFK